MSPHKHQPRATAMHLTTETAVTAIAQVQAAYNCSDLDAITRMQGAAAKAGDEASLEVLCAIKAELIAKALPLTTEVKATALAARIVRYCKARVITLDGLVAELDAGMPLDADRAKRLTTYCDQVQCLTLDGLVDQVWELRNEYAEAGNTAVRKATMRHTATLEVELAYNRAKSLAGMNLAGAVDELASAWNAMSGDALRDELRKLVTAHKVHVNGAHTARVNAGVNGVDRKVFADEV